MTRFNAQCQEDQWIAENLLPLTVIGTYCEVGAFNGIQSSNTLAFEDCGWKGVLVEADPFLAADCIKNRNATTWCCAAGSSRFGRFSINTEDRGLSGLSQNWDKSIMVPVLPLDVILFASGITFLDLLTIDTEGTELDVWRSRGLFKPRAVMIEYQTRDLPSQEERITRLLKSDGYTLRHKTAYNLIFEMV